VRQGAGAGGMLHVESEGALGFGIPEERHMISQRLTDNSINPALAEAPNDRARRRGILRRECASDLGFFMIIDAWIQHPTDLRR
jgi:hypothetical protein